MLYKNNKSGYTGIYYETKAKKYRASISVDGQKFRIGYFSNLQDAVVARQNLIDYYTSWKNFDIDPKTFPYVKFYLEVKLKYSKIDYPEEYSKAFKSCINALINDDHIHFWYAYPSDVSTLEKLYTVVPPEDFDIYLMHLNKVPLKKIAEKFNVSISTAKRRIDKVSCQQKCLSFEKD